MLLTLSNGNSVNVPHLGRNRGLSGLCEKTITIQTQNALRDKYGHDRVKVSCSAEFTRTAWTGEWWLDGKSLKYTVTGS